MLALALWRSWQCPRCGGDLRETTLADNEGKYSGSSVRCHSCVGLIQSEERHTRDKGEDRPASVLHKVERRWDRRR